MPSLLGALAKAELDAEAACVALDRAIGKLPPGNNKNAKKADDLTALREALKALVDPASLPGYCPARLVKRRRFADADAVVDGDDSVAGIVSHLFDRAINRAKGYGW